MAVADALFIRDLVSGLEQSVEENRLFLIGIKYEIYDLVKGLKSFSAILHQASKNQRAKYALKDIMDKIRKVISDAEHTICMYSAERKKRTSETNCIQRFAGEIQSIRDRAKKIKEDYSEAVRVLICNAPITDVSVEEPVNRLDEVVEENAKLIMEIKDEVDDVVVDLIIITASLKELLKRQGAENSDAVKDVVGKIWNAVSNAEDMISGYILEKEKHKWVPINFRVSGFAKDIQPIRSQVYQIYSFISYVS
ncbi:uncharacterized protein LOC116004944 [Ipomoea triloba]|uniref:uncharacterized protein LOC116004944 n=1 Tax=Ipomoea triloba TaxID=35885 RepID=UPI00125E8F51|nr:uncharacterized protein LOC116004944 [Ipomoea triloba]